MLICMYVAHLQTKRGDLVEHEHHDWRLDQLNYSAIYHKTLSHAHYCFNDIPVNKSYFSVDEQTLNSSWMLFVDVNFKTGSRKHIALTQIRCVA